MCNVTITFKGNPGAGKSTLLRIARDTFEKLGFECSVTRINDAHGNESFVVQDPRTTIKHAAKAQ